MTEKELLRLLRRRTRKNADELDAAIEKRCARDATILMSDSSGFSRRTHEYGILQFLAVMTHCYDNLVPLVRRHGTVIAHGADNLLAVFDRPILAVHAAREMHQWLARRNEKVSEAEQFSLCIGIHHGKVLRLKDNVYGDPVNVAAKVGEDLAAKDEILITHKAARLLPSSVKRDYSRSAEIGGLTYELYKVRY